MTPLVMDILPLLLFLPILLTLILKKSKKNKEDRLPPSPPKLPIIGHLHYMGALPHRSLQKLSNKYGPILLLRLGSIPTLLVSSAQVAREVMNTHDVHCCSRPESPGSKRLSYGCKDVAFAPYGKYWREMRKLFVEELLSMKRVKSFIHVREAQVERLIKSLLLSSSTPVNLNEKIFALAEGIIGMVAFGKSYGSEQFKNKELQKVMSEVTTMLASFSGEDFFPSAAGQLIDRLTGLLARREKCFQELDALFETILNQHLDPARNPEQEQDDFVDVLINLSRKQAGSINLTRDHLKAMLMDTFVASIDTTAITMLWAMSELIRHPRVMKKVQTEIRSVIGKDKPWVESNEIASLPYLKMVVKETLRLHPPGPLLVPRETTSHVTIGGYDVPPKTRIFVNAWAIGRDPDSWEKPDEFYPERFECNEIDFKGTHFEFIPFGAGRRICPGMAMATTNVELALANLLYCFDWDVPEGMKLEDINMEEESSLTTHRKTPLYLVPIKYSWED